VGVTAACPQSPKLSVNIGRFLASSTLRQNRDTAPSWSAVDTTAAPHAGADGPGTERAATPLTTPAKDTARAGRLRHHGIEPRQARNTALAAWASDLPPAVLASLLGVHLQTAVNWASRTHRDWTAYLAERQG
jgi:hypothetical protein